MRDRVGGITGSTVVPTTSSASGIWTLREAQTYINAGAWPAGAVLDPDFANVSLLLHMDGTGASFVDSSATPKTVTALGDATQSATQSKWGGKSAYFDGTGDSLSTGATADTLLGQSGDFTVEMWLYPTSLSGTRALFSTRTNSSSNDVIIFGIRGSSVYVDTNAVGVVSEGVALTLDAWQHVALTRSGNTFTTYINGTVVATGSGSHSFSSAQSAIIGAEVRADGGSAGQFAGYIDDLRVTKGVARTITVPTAAYPNAGPAVTTPTDADFASVSLLLHMDGTNGSSTFTDSSLYATAGRLARQGNAQISTAQSQFGSASGLFGGASDWVTTPTDSTLTLGSGDCTLEFFFRSGNTSSRMGVVGNRTGSGGDAVFCVVLNPANLYGFGYILMHTDNSAIISTATSWSANAWHYCAIVRSGSAWSLYLDGTRVGTATSSVDLNATSTLYLGKEGSRNDQSSPMDGNIDELRITQGHARYTGATMTVPTAAYPSSGVYQDPFLAKVSILLPMDGTGASFSDSSLSPKTITAAGDATQSAAQSKWGGKSGLFDGTGDYLAVPSHAAFALGTGDFAVECWVYRTSAVSQGSVMGIGYGSGGVGIFINGSHSICVTRPGTAIDHTFAANVPMNAWSHIAIARSGTDLRCYVDGSQVGASAYSSTNYTQGELVIAMDGDKATQGYVGYIDDFRITKGTARGYTGSTITVPTAAFPNAGPAVSAPVTFAGAYLMNSTANYSVTGTSTVTAIVSGVSDGRLWLLVNQTGTLTYTVTANSELDGDGGRLYSAASAPALHGYNAAYYNVASIAGLTNVSGSVSGTATSSGTASVTAGQWLVIRYFKDGSVSVGNDSITAVLSIA